MQLISQKTSIRTTVYTRSSGRYEFPVLETGDYVLRLARPLEFRPYRKDSVRIDGRHAAAGHRRGACVDLRVSAADSGHPAATDWRGVARQHPRHGAGKRRGRHGLRRELPQLSDQMRARYSPRPTGARSCTA